MKTVLIIRHAKSGWDNTAHTDFERTLADNGISDAEIMARRLIERGIKIDSFVSSPARRAQQTAAIFMSEYKANEENLLLLPSLYEASVKHFYEAIVTFNDEDSTVALFAHNPGITDFVNSTGCSQIYNMPACAVFGLAINADHWKEFENAKKEFLFFDYPQNTPSTNEETKH
jgi:phosphohistidine phosphatase